MTVYKTNMMLAQEHQADLVDQFLRCAPTGVGERVTTRPDMNLSIEYVALKAIRIGAEPAHYHAIIDSDADILRMLTFHRNKALDFFKEVENEPA